ncbi:MAG: prephenate dehydrogenase/arogenate dehydrogenase family protein [Anaerolineales bacterium]|nr:prephenate dehydrogenase/arogenate dehydrogenase family protein [Anaerolineales bacterium]
MKITIIGLGKTGCSLGLALRGKAGDIQRIGHDREISIAKEAQKVGAIDRYTINLYEAVQNADVVFLAIPLDQVRETIEQIAQDLKEGAVLVELSPAKQKVWQWMSELIPPNRYYVGWNLAINPAYLQDSNKGVNASRQDYFHQGVVAVTAPQGTPAEVYDLMGELIRRIGAQPLFADMIEMDGVLAEAQVIPQLLSALMVYTLTRQPGWREARKFAAQDFWKMGLPVGKSISATELSHTLFANRETVERLINEILTVLVEWREQIQEGEIETLTRSLLDAQQRFEKWQSERMAADWVLEETGIRREDIPTSGEVFGRLIGFGYRKKREKE